MSSLPSIIIFCGPSGAGKTTIINRLIADYPNQFSLAISHTTRLPRDGEVNGRDYHFVSHQEMYELIAQDYFIESAEFAGNMYGTSFKSIDRIIDSGRTCLKALELQGVQSLKQSPYFEKTIVILLLPTKKELERRLRGRGDSDQDIAERMSLAQCDFFNNKETPAILEAVFTDNDLDKEYDKLLRFLNIKNKKV